MRIQLDLSPEKVSKLKHLMSSLDIDSYKDLFNNALAVFDWMVEETRSGRVIASVDEDEKRYKVLVVPALHQVAAGTFSHKNGVADPAAGVPADAVLHEAVGVGQTRGKARAGKRAVENGHRG